ncbi:hypothetical protein QC761_0046400 [Podospora bellae-mahoneyi]|uniref:Uncharacterized protein n=1 Tax=Podospora bellae-mahoneyi TaxID=2093777 RepID=A0ABR0FSW8_9PEZI|nr:hypothetical protein QC761_0046400 [Podospora bellae-mahoneyi]
MASFNHFDSQDPTGTPRLLSLPTRETRLWLIRRFATRGSWALRSFELRNTEWPGYLNDTCTEIGKELGIGAPIRAELYKMLIYEKGALFKPHTE